MLVLFLSLLSCFIIFLIVLQLYSSGEIIPFEDKAGNEIKESISEKIFVNINGVEQGMFIKGKDKSNPVLLFVHGGPGMPEYAISRKYPVVLENLFTVCWWEQRGAGLSYNSDIKPEQLNFDLLIDDVIGVTN